MPSARLFGAAIAATIATAGSGLNAGPAAARPVIPPVVDADFTNLARSVEFLYGRLDLRCVTAQVCLEPRCEAGREIAGALREARALLPKFQAPLDVYRKAVFDRYVSQLRKSKITGEQRAKALYAQFVQDSIYGVAKLAMDVLSFHEFLTDFKKKMGEYVKPTDPAYRAFAARATRLSRHVHDMLDRLDKARGYVRKAKLFADAKGIARYLENQAKNLNTIAKIMRRASDAMGDMNKAWALKSAGNLTDAAKTMAKARVNVLKIVFSIGEILVKADNAARAKRIQRDAEIEKAEDENARRFFRELVRINRRMNSLVRVRRVLVAKSASISVCIQRMCGGQTAAPPGPAPREPRGEKPRAYVGAVDRLRAYNDLLDEINRRLLSYRDRFRITLGAKPRLTFDARAYAPEQSVEAAYSVPRCIPRPAIWSLQKNRAAASSLERFDIGQRTRGTLRFTAPAKPGDYVLALKSADPDRVHGVAPLAVRKPDGPLTGFWRLHGSPLGLGALVRLDQIGDQVAATLIKVDPRIECAVPGLARSYGRVVWRGILKAGRIDAIAKPMAATGRAFGGARRFQLLVAPGGKRLNAEACGALPKGSCFYERTVERASPGSAAACPAQPPKPTPNKIIRPRLTPR